MNQDSPLFRAYNLVHGDRGEAYGEQAQDMDGLAAIWSVILGFKVTGEQAVLCLQALKMNRQAHNLRIGKFHVDSNEDTAGYVEVMHLVRQQHMKQMNDTCIHPGRIHYPGDTCMCTCHTCMQYPSPKDQSESDPLANWEPPCLHQIGFVHVTGEGKDTRLYTCTCPCTKCSPYRER